MSVPGLSEETNEFVLPGRGVLHFVNEQMTETPSSGEIEVGRGIARNENIARSESQFGVIALSAFGEEHFEFSECAAKDAE